MNKQDISGIIIIKVGFKADQSILKNFLILTKRIKIVKKSTKKKEYLYY